MSPQLSKDNRIALRKIAVRIFSALVQASTLDAELDPDADTAMLYAILDIETALIEGLKAGDEPLLHQSINELVAQNRDEIRLEDEAKLAQLDERTRKLMSLYKGQNPGLDEQQPGGDS